MSKSLLKGCYVVVALLLAVMIIGPFLVPVPPLENTVPPHQLADLDSHFIELLGIDVHYKIAGEDEPTLILLHGFGASEFTWREVFDDLVQLGRVIAYDRPAFGLTERPLEWETTNPYSQEFQIELLIALMDAFAVDKAILVGNSAGGTIAMRAYLEAPERVYALVLVDPAVYTGGGAPALLRPLLQTPQFDHLGPLLIRNIQVWGLDFLETAWHDPAKITPEVWEGYVRPLRADNWDRALWEITKASSASRLPEQLEQFDLPILVITGDDDRIVPTEDSIRLAATLPTADLVVIPNCGHVPHEECPNEFLRVIVEFVSRLTPEG